MIITEEEDTESCHAVDGEEEALLLVLCRYAEAGELVHDVFDKTAIAYSIRAIAVSRASPSSQLPVWTRNSCDSTRPGMEETKRNVWREREGSSKETFTASTYPTRRQPRRRTQAYRCSGFVMPKRGTRYAGIAFGVGTWRSLELLHAEYRRRFRSRVGWPGQEMPMDHSISVQTC